MIAKQKILIVDDDNNIAELISLYLTKECYECQIVNDGEAALQVLDSFQPNLVLLDLMLPGMDGYQVCRRSVTNPICPSSCFPPKERFSTKCWAWSWALTITSSSPLIPRNWWHASRRYSAASSPLRPLLPRPTESTWNIRI